MKHIKLFSTMLIVAIASILVSLSSCTSDDALIMERDNATSQVSSNLMEELENYAHNFLATHSGSRSKRGWGKFRDSLKADFVGYTDGNRKHHNAVSVGTSRKKWKDLKAQENTLLQPMTTQEIEELSSQIDSLKVEYQKDNTNFGAIHNAAILTMLINDQWEYNSTVELAESTIAALSELGVDMGNVTANEVATDIDSFFSDIYDSNVDVMFNRLKQKYPLRRKELDVLQCYLNTTDSIDNLDDVILFTNGYVNIIKEIDKNAKDLTDIEKSEIVGTITIGPNSLSLWQQLSEK
ncbi:MAG: hypothetical protein K2I28_04555 [Muribaculaceae bacterium]|nr:hypothetical protein [Muribaculaceae bacterium]